MKKLILALSVLTLTFSLGVGCAKNSETKTEPTAQADKTEAEAPKAEPEGKIVVGATPVPHAEILGIVKEVLKGKGYELEVKEFTDYVQPNLTLENKELDANFFQHLPYLDDFNTKNKTNIASVAAIHYEPLGLYPGKTKKLEELKDGATIAVPNDTTNEARALLLLETLGLIKVNPDAGLNATIKDITENPKNIKIQELEAAQIARSLQDVDVAVINGNYAIEAGLNAAADALAKEEKDSLAATTFANILAIRKGDENRKDIKALVEALKSEEVKKFIEEKYQGSVIPVF